MLRTFAIFAGSFALAACTATGGGGAPSLGGADAFPAKPAIRLSDIAGKEAAELDKLLGSPDLTRSEGKGEFRRYTLSTCALLVILYPDEQGASRAASVDAGALKSGEEKPDLDLCLARGKAKES